MPDKSGKSFLYSATHDDIYKIKDQNKAIGVSLVHGPIFGNGDLVIGDKAISNTSKFPVSYLPGRKKTLFKSQNFEIEEYDVFQL